MDQLSPEFQAMMAQMHGVPETGSQIAGSYQSLVSTLEKRAGATAKKGEETYFASYEDMRMHEAMVHDRPRTEGYHRALQEAGVQGKIVADAGAGTGVLSCFAAKAGAEKVYAIEASKVAMFARRVAEANGCTNVEVVEELLEKADLPQVDIIVSEWMGYFLIYEHMLPSVLSLRDRCLKEGGRMIPGKCTLFMAPLHDASWWQEKVEAWGDVCGLDMSCVRDGMLDSLFQQPLVRDVDVECVLGDGSIIFAFDAHTVSAEGVREFAADFEFEVSAPAIHGFVTWFDCELYPGVALSTSPRVSATHWKQTCLMLPDPLPSGKVVGKMSVSPLADFPRGLRIVIDGKVGPISFCHCWEFR
mmetsp:Transcript_57016/g.152298  ORF Transcript_57016/g.152298 Transcript_57016/m.152298 type:complete len:359 (-) Transcript_57016:24-1100(-)